MDVLFVMLLCGSLFIGSEAEYSMIKFKKSIAALKKFDQYFTKAVTDPLVFELLAYRSIDYVRQSLSYREPSDVPNLAMKAQDLFLHHLYFSSTILRRPTLEQMFVNAYITHLAYYTKISSDLCYSYTLKIPIKREKPYKDPNLFDREANCKIMKSYMDAFAWIIFRDRADEITHLVDKLKSKNTRFKSNSKAKTKRPDTNIVRSFVALPFIFHKNKKESQEYTAKMKFKDDQSAVLPFFWGGDYSEMLQQASLIENDMNYFIRREKCQMKETTSDDEIRKFEIEFICKMIATRFWLISQIRFFNDTLEENPLLLSSQSITYCPNLQESISIWDKFKDLIQSVYAQYDVEHRSLRSESSSFALNSNVAQILYDIEMLKFSDWEDLSEMNEDFVLRYVNDEKRESNIQVIMPSSDEDLPSKSKCWFSNCYS